MDLRLKHLVSRLLVLTAVCWVRLVCAQSQTHYDFNIGAKPVGDAIVDLAIQLDLNLVYLSELTDEKQSNGITGSYTVNEALELLLQGTDLKATVSNNRVIEIKKDSRNESTSERTTAPLQEPKAGVSAAPVTATVDYPMEEVVVVAQLISPYNLGSTVSSTKTQRDFLSTPQIVNGIPSELSRDIAGRTYADATLLVSSASYLERSAGVADELRLRGFAYPALKINGIGGHAYIAPVDIAFIERIEIAKGPSSVLFGRMEPGGLINMMLKQASNVPQNQFFAHHGSDDFARAELDVGYALSDHTAIRTIGFIQRQGNEDNLDLDDAQGGMLDLQHTLKNGAKISAHYRYESQDVLQQFGRPIEGFDSSVDVFREDNGDLEIIAPRQQDLRSGLNVDRSSAYFSVKDILIGKWSADAHLQYDNYRARSRVRFPIIEDFVIDFNDEQIDSDELTDALLEDDDFLDALLEGLETVSVDDDNIFFEEESFAYDTRFLSAELTVYNNRQLSSFGLEQLYGVNLSDSRPETLVWQTHDTRTNFLPLGQAEVLFNAGDVQSDVRDRNLGLFAQWAISGENWTAFAGSRIDYLEFEAQSETGEIARHFTEATYRLGGVYAFSGSSSLFFNYSEAISPQFSLTEVASDEAFEFFPEPIVTVAFPEPARSQQIEIGIKNTWFNDALQTSCALYQIEKDDIIAEIAAQRSRGLECDIVGSIGKGWHLVVGLSWLDAEITATDDEALLGRRPRMTPETSIRLWLNKDILISEHWLGNIGVGYTYIDERFVTAENFDSLAAYQLIDMGATLHYQSNLSLSVLIRNLLDEDFTQGVFNALPFWTNPGHGRVLESRFTYFF